MYKQLQLKQEFANPWWRKWAVKHIVCQKRQKSFVWPIQIHALFFLESKLLWISRTLIEECESMERKRDIISIEASLQMSHSIRQREEGKKKEKIKKRRRQTEFVCPCPVTKIAQATEVYRGRIWMGWDAWLVSHPHFTRKKPRSSDGFDFFSV